MRGGNVAAVGLATICGVATAYTTLQPALEEQKEKREGTFHEDHKTPEDQERIISKQITSDLQVARDEVTKKLNDGGFAWGIRKWFADQEPRQQSSKSDATKDDATKNT